MVAARTKAALQAAKARGVQLGRNGAEYSRLFTKRLRSNVRAS
jgi:hypothetical protein